MPYLTRSGKEGRVGARQSPVNNWPSTCTVPMLNRTSNRTFMKHHDNTSDVQVTRVGTVAKVCLHGPDTHVRVYFLSSSDFRHRPLRYGIYQNSNKPIILAMWSAMPLQNPSHAKR